MRFRGGRRLRGPGHPAEHWLPLAATAGARVQDGPAHDQREPSPKPSARKECFVDRAPTTVHAHDFCCRGLTKGQSHARSRE